MYDDVFSDYSNPYERNFFYREIDKDLEYVNKILEEEFKKSKNLNEVDFLKRRIILFEKLKQSNSNDCLRIYFNNEQEECKNRIIEIMFSGDISNESSDEQKKLLSNKIIDFLSNIIKVLDDSKNYNNYFIGYQRNLIERLCENFKNSGIDEYLYKNDEFSNDKFSNKNSYTNFIINSIFDENINNLMFDKNIINFYCKDNELYIDSKSNEVLKKLIQRNVDKFIDERKSVIANLNQNLKRKVSSSEVCQSNKWTDRVSKETVSKSAALNNVLK